MGKMNNKFFFIILFSLFINPAFAQPESEVVQDAGKTEIIQVTKEFCRKHHKATQIQNFISEEYVNRISTEQYNNIIKMFSIRCDAITEESSLAEKKFILAYWIKEKYFSSDDVRLSLYEFLDADAVKKINDTTYETSIHLWAIPDFMDIFLEMYGSLNVPENCIIVTWIKEGDEWKINDIIYDFNSPLYKDERRYDLNKKHKSPVLVDARFNKNIDADITIPIVEGNLHNKKLEDYYAGGLLRWSKGNNKNNIFKLYNGFSWQLTDTNNYFFIDFGAGLKFNIFFGNCFAITPEISAIGKINIVLSQLAFGFDTEGGTTFHFHSISGREAFYFRAFYQHTFLYEFDFNSENKDLNNYNFGKLGFGFGIPIY